MSLARMLIDPHLMGWRPIPNTRYLLKYGFYNWGYELIATDIASVYFERFDSIQIMQRFNMLNKHCYLPNAAACLDTVIEGLQKALDEKTWMETRQISDKVVISIEHTYLNRTEFYWTYSFELELNVEKLIEFTTSPMVFKTLMTQRKVLKMQNEKNETFVAISEHIFVTGLAEKTTARDLETLFSKHGNVFDVGVSDAKMPGTDHCGFVTMNSSIEAAQCIQILNRTKLLGHIITVKEVTIQQTRSIKTAEDLYRLFSQKKPEKSSESSECIATTVQDPIKPEWLRGKNIPFKSLLESFIEVHNYSKELEAENLPAGSVFTVEYDEKGLPPDDIPDFVKWIAFPGQLYIFKIIFYDFFYHIVITDLKNVFSERLDFLKIRKRLNEWNPTLKRKTKILTLKDLKKNFEKCLASHEDSLFLENAEKKLVLKLIFRFRGAMYVYKFDLDLLDNEKVQKYIIYPTIYCALQAQSYVQLKLPKTKVLSAPPSYLYEPDKKIPFDPLTPISPWECGFKEDSDKLDWLRKENVPTESLVEEFKKFQSFCQDWEVVNFIAYTEKLRKQIDKYIETKVKTVYFEYEFKRLKKFCYKIEFMHPEEYKGKLRKKIVDDSALRAREEKEMKLLELKIKRWGRLIEKDIETDKKTEESQSELEFLKKNVVSKKQIRRIEKLWGKTEPNMFQQGTSIEKGELERKKRKIEECKEPESKANESELYSDMKNQLIGCFIDF